MSAAVLLPLAIVAGAGLIFLVVIGILAVAFRKRPEQPGWHATPRVPDMPYGGPVGVWNAELLGGGTFGAVGRVFGTFRLERGVLAFTPEEAHVPAWAFPCHQLTAGGRGFFSLDGGDVVLSGPMGVLRCSVSEERINRLSANTAKDLRERQYAQQFIALLHAHGARPSR